MSKIELAKEIVARHTTEEVLEHTIRYLAEARRIADLEDEHLFVLRMGEALAGVEMAEAFLRELKTKLSGGSSQPPVVA